MRYLALTYCAALALAACNGSDDGHVDEHWHPDGEHTHPAAEWAAHSHTPQGDASHTHPDDGHGDDHHVHSDAAISQVWALIDAGPHHVHEDDDAGT